MVEEAQGLRARVLADLARRRKVLHAQIEQLRAGRERLAETVKDVRRSVDVIADDLFAAEDNARLAAEAAGREAVARPDEGTPEELAALLLAEGRGRRGPETGPGALEVGRSRSEIDVDGRRSPRSVAWPDGGGGDGPGSSRCRSGRLGRHGRGSPGDAFLATSRAASAPSD